MAVTKCVNAKYSSKTSLKKAVEYITDSKKTSSDLIASNCGTNDPKEVIERMLATKEMWNKTDGTQCFHDVVSLAPGEGTPEQMLSFAKKYAAAKYGEEYEAVIAVHTDKGHLHAHIVANSVSLTTGKKYSSRPETLRKMRKVTDNLCKEFGFKITEKGKHCDGTVLTNTDISSFDKATYEQLKKADSWLKTLYKDVSYAATHSRSYNQFLMRLQAKGISVRETNAHLTYIDKDGHHVRDTRISNTFHRDFSKAKLEEVYAKMAAEAEAKRAAEEAKKYEAVTVYSIRISRAKFIKHKDQILFWTSAKHLRFWVKDDPIHDVIIISSDVYKTLKAIFELIDAICKLVETFNPSTSYYTGLEVKRFYIDYAPGRLKLSQPAKTTKEEEKNPFTEELYRDDRDER